MPDKKGSMEKAYEDAMAGKDAAKAEAKAKNAMVAKKEQAFAKKKKAPPLDPMFGMPPKGIIKIDPRESDGTFNKNPNPIIGIPKQPKPVNPKQPKPRPAKGMPY